MWYMTDSVTFTIPGKPMTWARTIANFGKGDQRRARFATPSDRRMQMQLIAGLWQERGYDRFERGVWLGLGVLFVFDRPASHYGTGRNSGVLKERFRHAYPGTGVNGGDLDNLVKLVADSLNKVAFYDDSQIASMRADKRYAGEGEVSHTEVHLWDLANPVMLEQVVEPPRQLELVAA